MSDIGTKSAIPETDEEKTGKSPQGTFAMNVRQKIRQMALDTTDSFREGPPANRNGTENRSLQNVIFETLP